MSCLNARWITPSDAAAALRSRAEIVKGAAKRLGPGRGEGGGRGVRTGEPDDLMARVDELGTTAEPIQPDAPVTNTRMRTSR